MRVENNSDFREAERVECESAGALLVGLFASESGRRLLEQRERRAELSGRQESVEAGRLGSEQLRGQLLHALGVQLGALQHVDQLQHETRQMRLAQSVELSAPIRIARHLLVDAASAAAILCRTRGARRRRPVGQLHPASRKEQHVVDLTCGDLEMNKNIREYILNTVCVIICM